MERGHTYNTYASITSSAILFICLTPTTAIIGLTVYLCRAAIKKNFKLPIWNSVYKALKQIYGDHLENRDDIYEVHGRRAPPIMLLFFFIAEATILCCTLVSFWTILVIAASDKCTDEMDCFALFENLSAIQNTPLMQNCTIYQDMNFTILNVIALFLTILMPLEIQEVCW